MGNTDKQKSVKLAGIIGSEGASIAKAYVFKKSIEVEKKSITDDKIESELERLDVAIEMTRKDIETTQTKALEEHGEKYAAIFDSHLLMLDDPQFKPKMIATVKQQKVNVESVVKETIDNLKKIFSAIEDPYLRERAIDIKDVGDRLLRHLMGLDEPACEIGKAPYILVAQELTPGEILDFAKGNLKGVCLDSGGATSHVAILAGALSIPSVFGLSNFSMIVRTGDAVLIDTRDGCKVILNPSKKAVHDLQASLVAVESKDELSDTTKDGYKVKIGANVARTEELDLLNSENIRRIGLFRSEFMFMEGVDLPSEKFQREVYTKVVKTASEMAVIRTIDIGSDKPLKYLPFPHEENPAMGFRSIRFSLSRTDILLPQLRAILSAAKYGNCKIIFPMVSTVSELAQISEVYEQAVDEVKPEIVPEWGIMVEVPSAVFMMEDIAKYTKYISLGTNDLLQFFYGIDRTNEKLVNLASPLNVSFLRLLFTCVAAAKAEEITIGICGEMASSPAGFFALLGIGVDEFSMRPAAINSIKRLIPKINKRETTKFIQEILTIGNDVIISDEISKAFPDLKKYIKG